MDLTALLADVNIAQGLFIGFLAWFILRHNDLRKNLRILNDHMDMAGAASAACGMEHGQALSSTRREGGECKERQ